MHKGIKKKGDQITSFQGEKNFLNCDQSKFGLRIWQGTFLQEMLLSLIKGIRQQHKTILQVIIWIPQAHQEFFSWAEGVFQSHSFIVLIVFHPPCELGSCIKYFSGQQLSNWRVPHLVMNLSWSRTTWIDSCTNSNIQNTNKSKQKMPCDHNWNSKHCNYNWIPNTARTFTCNQKSSIT